jgi:hypothetical protein
MHDLGWKSNEDHEYHNYFDLTLLVFELFQINEIILKKSALNFNSFLLISLFMQNYG